MTLSESDVGSIARIENVPEGFEKWLSERRAEKEDVERRLEASKIQLQQPFEHEEALQKILSELESVNAALDIDKGGDAGVVMDDAPADGQDKDVLGLDEEAGDEDEPEV